LQYASVSKQIVNIAVYLQNNQNLKDLAHIKQNKVVKEKIDNLSKKYFEYNSFNTAFL